jgi:fimbrial chaperone protein
VGFNARPGSDMTLIPRTATLPALALLLVAPAAAASQFTVNPTRVELSTRVTSAVVSVRNDGQSAIRIQVKTHAWTQTLDGQMQLDPTEDVIVFPTLVTLNPGEQRRLRVALTSRAADLERTYRMFLEELPPPKTDSAGTGVQVLTRVGIPIFLAPVSTAAHASLSEVGLSGGTLHFQVDNTGNTHLVPETVRVRGLSGSGEPVSDRSRDGWYILGHSSRRYEMKFADADCGRVRSVLIDVKIGDTLLKDRLDTPAGACAR